MPSPDFCPWCGQKYQQRSLVQEFWARDERWFSCWCVDCGRSVELGIVSRIVITAQFQAEPDAP